MTKRGFLTLALALYAIGAGSMKPNATKTAKDCSLLQKASALLDHREANTSIPSGMMRIRKAVVENRCNRPVWLYGYQDGVPTHLKIPAKVTEEFTEERGFLIWREQRITVSYGSFFDGELRPTNLDAAVIELNADYEGWVVPKSHVSFLGQLGYSNLNLELAFWLDKINGTLAVETPANPACFSRAKTAFNVSECSFPDGSGQVLLRTWGELCMPVCPHTGEATEVPCNTSCFEVPGTPIKYPEYISHRSLAFKQGRWVPSPATVDKFVREDGQQWSATFECWDFQTGPVGFPICDGYDPKNWPDEVGVWQVVTCPDGEIDPPPVPYRQTASKPCENLTETCSEDITWAMTVGIYTEPEWYPGLTPTSSKDEFQLYLSEVLGSCPPPCQPGPYFEPVDGGVGRVCRGLTPTDNSNSYFTVRVANSTDQCKALCVDYPGCKGIEFALSGRCEIWLREGGIEASNVGAAFECWRYVNDEAELNVTTTLAPNELMYFEGFDGVTQDRVCRGANSNDNSASYYSLYWASTLEGCKSLCVDVTGCKGVEYAASIGRCEVWTRPEGIQAVRELENNECWIYAPPGTGVGTIDAW
ncbi:unnamed protein product [Effrenium voratum]|uniref:Apple domain-containing protein n=2 Tax=Effrenium voratum TaxID=2562239 RepID=A0AA36IA41_9DINO|nr:unnamed protein product [Effrenium voratum]CAJ1434559.1 unnamed protein product [Effrenium voratum]